MLYKFLALLLSVKIPMKINHRIIQQQIRILTETSGTLSLRFDQVLSICTYSSPFPSFFFFNFIGNHMRWDYEGENLYPCIHLRMFIGGKDTESE